MKDKRVEVDNSMRIFRTYNGDEKEDICWEIAVACPKHAPLESIFTEEAIRKIFPFSSKEVYPKIIITVDAYFSIARVTIEIFSVFSKEKLNEPAITIELFEMKKMYVIRQNSIGLLEGINPRKE